MEEEGVRVLEGGRKGEHVRVLEVGGEHVRVWEERGACEGVGGGRET